MGRDLFGLPTARSFGHLLATKLSTAAIKTNREYFPLLAEMAGSVEGRHGDRNGQIRHNNDVVACRDCDTQTTQPGIRKKPQRSVHSEPFERQSVGGFNNCVYQARKLRIEVVP